MDTGFGSRGGLERQVNDELAAAAEYLGGMARDGADAAAPVATAGATLVVAGLALGVMALPAAGTFTLLCASMALSGSILGLATMAGMSLADSAGRVASPGSREAMDLAVDLASSPFTLGFGVASTAIFGGDELQRAVEIGRLVNIAADLKSLVSRGARVERLSSSVGVLTGLSQLEGKRLSTASMTNDATARTEDAQRTGTAAREAAREAAMQEAAREAAMQEAARRRSIEQMREYQYALEIEARLKAERAEQEARRESERRLLEEQLRREREENDRKAREAEQLRKAAEEARQRAAEAEERAKQQERDAEQRREWERQAEAERQRAQEAQFQAEQSERARRQRGIFDTGGGGSTGGYPGQSGQSPGQGPSIGPT